MLVDERNFRQAVLLTIDKWDPNSGSVDLTTELTGARGKVSLIVCTAKPEPASRLAAMVHERTGRPVSVHVEYRLNTKDTATRVPLVRRGRAWAPG